MARKSQPLWIGLTEYAVFNHPPEMDGWRMYRIEYGGVNKDQLTEGTIWLPPHVDAEDVEWMFEEWQK